MLIIYIKDSKEKGNLERDVDRLVRNDRIAWGASMIACKDADAMVTGNIRHYAASIEKLKKSQIHGRAKKYLE